MKLFFKISLDDDLEKTLAASRYQRFWNKNQQKILDSFYKHTRLKFKQNKITVRIRRGSRSTAGNTKQPMRLSMDWADENTIGCTLIHELAHRLVIGNSIEPSEDNKFIKAHANYYMHRHIDLFLYDVYVDILGIKVAQDEVNRESGDPTSLYTKAWSWALTKNYSQRQQSFKLFKRRYVRNISE